MPGGHRAASAVLVTGAAFAAALAALTPAGVRATLWAVGGVAAAAAILRLAGRSRGSNPLAGWLIAAGVALVSVAHAGRLGTPSPGVADVALLVAFPALAAGVVALHRVSAPRDRDSLLDALIVTVAAAQTGWLAVVDPLLSESSATTGAILVSVARPLGALLLLAVVARLTFAVAGPGTTHARPALRSRLLCAGLGIGVAAEFGAALTGSDDATLLWLPALALTVLAHAVRDDDPGTPPLPGDLRQGSTWRLVASLALACLISPVLVLTRPLDDERIGVVVILGGTVTLFLLALLRIVNLLSRLRLAGRREHALRDATAAFVGAADRASVRDAALDAAVELLGAGDVRAWTVDSDPGGTVAQAVDDAEVATFVDASELALFPDGEGGVEVVPGPSMLHATLGVPGGHALVLIALPVRGAGREAAVVATPQAPSPRVLAALRSLTVTMRLALERLDVGEIMVERRSERRLRLMLQYASDVILILDHDLTVVHATEGVGPIIGLPAPELLGMSWLDLVAVDDSDAARDLVSLAQGGRPARGELRLNHEDGSARHVDTVVTEVIDEDLMGFVVTCHDITNRHELEQQLTHQAFHDALTGLANRALFRDRLGHAMARARGLGGYSVLFIDLDDFKNVNDSLGHAAGDVLLREMTTRLRTCLREGDTAARLGGDEFAILLEDVGNEEHSREIAERILAVLAEPFDIAGTEVTTGASIGIARGSTGGATPEDLMRNADLALYEAKNSGKNCFAVFAPAMHEAALARLSLTSELRHAVERNELVVHYQPLVALETGQVLGMEALVRWHHPRLGMLPPGDFISLAEETGLIVPIGRLVLDTALSAAAHWQRTYEHHRALRIAVNVSGRQLQDPGFVADVESALRSSGIDPATVVLEITESILLPGETAILGRMQALAALGVELYIDDFGTGYSSLSYLQTLPVNGLKLAQEFVDTLPGTDTESGLVSTIRNLAETLGLSAIVAEGIERPEQWTSLLSLGYQVGQGFHLAVPVPTEDVPGLLMAGSLPATVAGVPRPSEPRSSEPLPEPAAARTD